MKKSKLFIENMVIFGLGGVISKLIPIIMVPIVTRLLPDTSYYGLSDLCTTILSFGSALAVMGMYDAMFRVFFDKDNDIEHQKQVCSTAILFTFMMSICVFLIMLFLKNILSEFVFGDVKYSYLVVIAAVGSAITGTNTIIGAPTRMQNKRKVYLTVNTIMPIMSYSIAIPFILKGYYIIALPLATILSDACVIVIYYCINREWFSFKKFNKNLLKPLLTISVPLFPTFLLYWVFSSSDKIMISKFLDIAQVGIYTAGSKLGHCSQIIYLAFAGGWSYFAFKTMKDANQVETRSQILEYLGVLSFTVGILVFALCKPICEWLYVGDYIKGYIVAPYLFMAPLIQMLFQVVANQFTIRKKTWLTTLTLTSGAGMNVVLNYCLIPVLGIEGASIASLLGYIISTIMAILILLKMHLISISLRFLCTIGITLVYILLWRIIFMDHIKIAFLGATGIGLFFISMYLKDIKALFISIKSKE